MPTLSSDALESVASEVEKAVAARRVGQPVTARIHAACPTTDDGLGEMAHQWLSHFDRWFQGTRENVTVQPTAAGTHVTLFATYSNGETVLLSCTSQEVQTDHSLELLLIGSQGSLRFVGP